MKKVIISVEHSMVTPDGGIGQLTCIPDVLNIASRIVEKELERLEGARGILEEEFKKVGRMNFSSLFYGAGR